MYHANDTYMKTQLKAVKKDITVIKRRMLAIEDMRPGSLTQQMRKAKGKYGAYWQLSYTHKGKGRTGYIREEFVTQIKKETANYKQHKILADKLVNLSIELSNLKMAIGKKRLALK